VIADIGAGSGYFTFRLARHVGDTGRVYAVDVSPEMIVHLNRRIRASAFTLRRLRRLRQVV
jgi:FkbM family methyltransferase